MRPETLTNLVLELLIRTRHLMLAVEDSADQIFNQTSGKALIFGNFATARIPQV